MFSEVHHHVYVLRLHYIWYMRYIKVTGSDFVFYSSYKQYILEVDLFTPAKFATFKDRNIQSKQKNLLYWKNANSLPLPLPKKPNQTNKPKNPKKKKKINK